MSARKFAAFVLIFFLSLVSVHASETKQDAVELEGVTVIGTQPGVDITPEKTIIDMDEFKKVGGVDTVEDVLHELGGIDVQRKNPLMASPGDQISVRGLTEGRLVVEIDGRRINHTGHYGKYIVDWSTLDVDDIERIEFIRGGHSVLHPFAMGGVINLITKKGRETQETKPDISMEAGYGEFDTYSLATSVTGGWGNLIGYHFSAKKKETDGYHKNEFQDVNNFNGRLSFYLPREASLTLGMKYSDVNYGYPVINDPNDPDPKVAEKYDDDYPKFKRSADQLRHLNYPQLPTGGSLKPEWEKHTGYYDAIFQMPLGPGEINIHGYWTEGRRWTSTYRKGANMTEPEKKFNKDNFVSDRTKGMIFEYRDIELMDSHSITLGYDHQELGSQDDITYVVDSGYIQDVIELGKRWTITPGVRYYYLDMNTYKGWWEMDKFEDNNSPPPGWPFSADNSQSETDAGFYPSLKVDFRATPDTTVYAALSRSYRLPCP